METDYWGYYYIRMLVLLLLFITRGDEGIVRCTLPVATGLEVCECIFLWNQIMASVLISWDGVVGIKPDL